MPYVHHKNNPVPPEHDRRRKLSEADKQSIWEEWEGGKSQRQLAREYGVSRRLVSFTVHPEKLAETRKRYRERQKEGRYYDKDRHAAYIRNHRRYKQSLVNNKII